MNIPPSLPPPLPPLFPEPSAEVPIPTVPHVSSLSRRDQEGLRFLGLIATVAIVGFLLREAPLHWGLIVGLALGVFVITDRFVRSRWKQNKLTKTHVWTLVGIVVFSLWRIVNPPAYELKAAAAREDARNGSTNRVEGRLFNNSEERAKNCAETLVLKNIKAPSTATFAETRIIYKEHPWYQIYVLVDAQNSFGAYIRSSFVCTLELGEGDQFRYMPAAGIQATDENMIKLGGVLEGIRAASNWPGANNDESK